MPSLPRLGFALAAALALATSCHRLADEPEDEIDFEALKIESCVSACSTLDTCEPDRFEGMEPDDCFERCMTLLPNLHEENQCGSREMIYLRCLGGLDCEGYAAFDVGNDPNHLDHSAPCVTEISRTIGGCDLDEPFDIDEPVPE